MKLSDRIQLLRKIALDPEALADQAATRDMTPEARGGYERVMYNPSQERLDATLNVLEGALGFIPVVGESIALYQGSKILINANSKWDYAIGGLLIFLGLFGLNSIAGGRAGIEGR